MACFSSFSASPRAVEANQELGAIVQQGGVRVIGLGGDEGDVEWIGQLVMAGFDVNPRQQTGDVGVGRVRRVERFDQRGGLGDLSRVTGGERGIGKLGGEAGIVGRVRQRGDEQRFGFGWVVFREQYMGQRGSRLRIGRVAGKREIAAVGLLRCGQVGGGFCDFGGEEDVLGLLGAELERGEKLVGGSGRVGRPGLLVELSQGAEGAGLEDRLDAWKGG